MKLAGKRTALLLIGFAFAVSFMLAQAKKSPSQSSPPNYISRSGWAGIDGERLLQAVDADRDGVITREEWDQFFRDHDNNKNDRLEPDEVRSAQAGGAKEESSEALNPDYDRLKSFARLDVNKNDVLERSEWPGNDRSFQRMDANHDGHVSKEEFLSRNARYWTQRFEDVDLNGDGLISRDEWMDSKIGFDRLDHDRNGVIDRFEFYTPE